MGAMITTKDNPYDPRLDFRAWFLWDTSHGYNTCGYLARIAAVAEDFPQPVIDRQTEDAIDEIIEMHNGEIYVKLMVDDEPTTPTGTSSNSEAA